VVGVSRDAGGSTGTAPGAHEFDARPGRTALAAVLLPGVVSVLALLSGGPAALAGVLGLGLLAAGARAGRRDLVGGGAVALFAGTLLAGALGASPAALVIAAGAALVAWDAAEHAIGLGEQVGRRADAGRAVAVHVAGGGLLVAVGGGVAYGAYRLVGSESPLALALLLAGAVALVTVLRA
jgi:hypothetical protein